MKTVKLTGTEVQALLVACDSVNITKMPGVKWSFLVTLISCDMKLRAFDKAMKAAGDTKNMDDGLGEKYDEFNKMRIELCEKHAKKDPDGTAVTTFSQDGPRYAIEDTEKFTKDLEKLQKKFKAALDAREAQTEAVKEMLDAEAEYELPEVKMKDVPETITPILLRPFAKLLAEGE